MTKRVFDDDYEDIIRLPHHISSTRNRMSLLERAAQFSPFAALTGHNEAIREAELAYMEHIELENAKVPIEEIEDIMV